MFSQNFKAEESCKYQNIFDELYYDDGNRQSFETQIYIHCMSRAEEKRAEYLLLTVALRKLECYEHQ